MLLTTLVLSGTLLAATTLAGLLMVYQIRQSSNANQSAEAIFAADAGIEYELYRFYVGQENSSACNEAAPGTLENGAEITTEVERVNNEDGEPEVVVRATGVSGRSARAFTLNLGYLDQQTCSEQGL